MCLLIPVSHSAAHTLRFACMLACRIFIYNAKIRSLVSWGPANHPCLEGCPVDHTEVYFNPSPQCCVHGWWVGVLSILVITHVLAPPQARLVLHLPSIFGKTQHTCSAYRGPLHTRAKGRDHWLWEPKRKCPKAVPTHLHNRVMWSRTLKCKCEFICDRTLNQMLFQWIFIHAGLHAL